MQIISESLVLRKCSSFADFQVLPLANKFNPEGWLSNFDASEKPYANVLLNSFIYYSEDFTAQLLRNSIQSLSMMASIGVTDFKEASERWENWISNVIICRITGETPNDSDSGYTMVRMARQRARIQERQIFGPEDALALLSTASGVTVVFLDDFIGSGEQFIKFWNRRYSTANGVTSFAELAASGFGHSFNYLPIVATKYGIDRISSKLTGATIAPCHLLGPEYNVLSAESKIWPDALKSTAAEVIHRSSIRAGISEQEWLGFHDLSLAFAFEHSTPDATLPIFYAKTNGWIPLVNRS